MHVEEFVSKAQAFIAEEKRVEQEEFFHLYQKYTNNELESMGFALKDLKISKVKSAFFKKTIIVFSKADGSPFLKSLKIKMNDNVIVAERKTNKDQENLKTLYNGVVYRLRSDSIHVLIDDKASNIKTETLSSNVCILKAGDNVTFDRRTN
jgi:hypothetical protein